MVVNTASECGHTPQYSQMEAIYKKYKDQGFVLIAFPSNDFGGQEPGTEQEILEFCTTNYETTFPIMAKVKVLGDKADPIYQFLQQKALNGYIDSEVPWNFQKFLLNEEGHLEQVVHYRTLPNDPSIIAWIEGVEK